MRTFVLFLKIQDLLYAFSVESLKKEKKFLILHFAYKKKNSTHKAMVSKIKLVTDEALEAQARSLLNLFKKRRLEDKYVNKIHKMEERIRILKTLYNPKNMKHEKICSNLCIMLNRSGIRQDVINRFM